MAGRSVSVVGHDTDPVFSEIFFVSAVLSADGRAAGRNGQTQQDLISPAGLFLLFSFFLFALLFFFAVTGLVLSSSPMYAPALC